MQHVPLVALPPVFPPVFLYMLFMLHAKLVQPPNGCDPDTVLVYTHVVPPAMLDVQPVNLTVELINFLYLVNIVVRLGAIIREPG